MQFSRLTYEKIWGETSGEIKPPDFMFARSLIHFGKALAPFRGSLYSILGQYLLDSGLSLKIHFWVVPTLLWGGLVILRWLLLLFSILALNPFKFKNQGGLFSSCFFSFLPFFHLKQHNKLLQTKLTCQIRELFIWVISIWLIPNNQTW